MNRAASNRIDAHPSKAVSHRALESPHAACRQARKLPSPSKRPFRLFQGNCSDICSSAPCIITIGASSDRLSGDPCFTPPYARARQPEERNSASRRTTWCAIAHGRMVFRKQQPSRSNRGKLRVSWRRTNYLDHSDFTHGPQCSARSMVGDPQTEAYT